MQYNVCSHNITSIHISTTKQRLAINGEKLQLAKISVFLKTALIVTGTGK